MEESKFDLLMKRMDGLEREIHKVVTEIYLDRALLYLIVDEPEKSKQIAIQSKILRDIITAQEGL